MFSSKNPTFISSRRRNCSVQITFSRSAGSDFPSLRTLHLGDNHLPQLPETIGNLRGLMCLSRSRFFFVFFLGGHWLLGMSGMSTIGTLATALILVISNYVAMYQ